jgi:tubulin polyglutamylase TTLL9
VWKERGRKTRQPGAQIRFKTNFTNTVVEAFLLSGFKRTQSQTDWDIMWTERAWIRGVYDRIHLDAHQRVNHFRNYYELTRKDMMIKNLKRMKRKLIKEQSLDEAAQYDFFPETFALPSEYLLFVEAFKKLPENTSWIMKPVGRCQGKGIFLFDKLNAVNDWKSDYRYRASGQDAASTAEKYVVQQYIGNPMLIGGKKFDMRLYALVTSFVPLTAYMYREGFCRFSSERYEHLRCGLGNDSMHLTNVAIQKKSDSYDAETGQKWDLHEFKQYVIAKYGSARTNQMFAEIQDVGGASALATFICVVFCTLRTQVSR